MDPKWYDVCWPRLTVKRVEPVVSISWASCYSSTGYQIFNFKHGFPISKHVRTCRHVKIIGPAASTSSDTLNANVIQTTYTTKQKCIISLYTQLFLKQSFLITRVSLLENSIGTSVVGLNKIEQCVTLPDCQKLWRYAHSFRHNTGIGQTNGIAKAISLSALRALHADARYRRAMVMGVEYLISLFVFAPTDCSCRARSNAKRCW